MCFFFFFFFEPDKWEVGTEEEGWRMRSGGRWRKIWVEFVVGSRP